MKEGKCGEMTEMLETATRGNWKDELDRGYPIVLEQDIRGAPSLARYIVIRRARRRGETGTCRGRMTRSSTMVDDNSDERKTMEAYR